MFDLIDFKGCEILYREDSEYKKEDLLLLKCKNGRLIDLGWYGRDNKYCILVIKDEDWSNPCYRIDGQPKLEYIEHYLQKVINFETAIFDLPIQERLNKITEIIDSCQSFEDAYGNIVLSLEQLRDMGFGQSEVATYIEMYAIKYIDSDEERWGLACDILDRIVGYCTPAMHIWRDRA